MNQSRKSIQYRDEPIPLITLDQKKKKYHICDEAIEFIKQIPQPIGVVAVAGMYRTGKSYLLNRMLLNQSSGFGVGPTVNACTKGLWVWGKPLIGQSVDGEPINVLVIDSEGIGALDEDSSHDNRVFALTILLSSCFIYNQVGSIDENALQNLSLVVNLTKNIHIKSNINEEIDLEDYALYFPSFMWVIRDFSLQLVNNDGESMTSKEYLERALAPQKGFSDSIEQKNRIRRLLTTFFKERDCMTLVRPLINEENLQNLDKMDFDQLRPEFFEQVITLRKKILNKLKIKTLNGKCLNGEMFVGLAKSYVDSINNGAVPNIQDAWTYICKNECLKAMFDAIEIYDKNIKEMINNKIPTILDELKVYHKMAKETALGAFKKKAVGEILDEFLKDFQKKIKQKFQNIKLENEKESKIICSQFISQEFITIEKKLKNREYKNFQEYEREVKLFYNYFMENGPKTSNKQTIVLEFIHRVITDGASYFLRLVQNECEIQKSLSLEFQKKMEENLKDQKEDFKREKHNQLSKIAQLEQQKAELEVNELALKELIDELKIEKENTENSLQNEISKEKFKFQRLDSEQQNKSQFSEEKIKELEKEIFMKNSEFDKEKALFQQKIGYLEKNLEEYQRKEKEQSNELKINKKEHISQMKDVSNKYEMQNKILQSKVNELQENILEIENDLATKEQKMEMERKKWCLNENNYSLQLKEAQQTIQDLSKEIKDLKLIEEKNALNLKSENKKDFDTMTKRIADMEQELSCKEEIIKQVKSQGERDKAVLMQQNEFLEVQLKECKSQIVENKKSHDAILQAFEQNNESINKIDCKQMQEIKESHKIEVKKIQEQYESTKKRLTDQIQNLSERNNQLELKLKLDNSEKSKEILNLKESLENSVQTIQKLQDQNKSLDNQKLSLLKETEDRYKGKIQQLEQLLEAQKSKNSKELSEIEQKSEESLAQLKNFYEIERERLEKRIQEEKSRSDKKIQILNEEYEQKLRDEENNYEEEIENLKEELSQQEIQTQSIVQQYEHEIDLKNQTLESLEKYVKESKESLQNIQNSNNQNIEQQQNSFNQERKNLQSRIDQYSNEISKREKEILSIIAKKEQLEALLNKKEQAFEVLKLEFNEEKQAFNQKINELRQKLQTTNDEYFENKIQNNRELALAKQQNEFLNKKIEDLTKLQENSLQRFEEKYKSQKEELQEEYEEKIKNLNDERTLLQQKYEKLKKLYKDQDSSYAKQIGDLEREKVIYQEKIYYLENKKLELESRLEQDVSMSNSQLVALKDSQFKEKQQIKAEIEKLKQLKIQLELEKSEIMTNYEKDKALWEGKFCFLEQQRDQAKLELIESAKKFEITLNHLKNQKSSEMNDFHQIQLQETIESLEKKHTYQLQDMQNEHQKTLDQYEDSIKKLENTIQQYNEKQLLENQGKLSSQVFNEKKLSEYMQREKALVQEVEDLKQERDKKLLEFQKDLDNERDKFKAQIVQIEIRLKESDNKRTSLLFEHEKERAKWNLEKDHIINQKNDCKELIEKLEKKKENLLRENEKLKSESKQNKKNTLGLFAGAIGNAQLIGSKNKNLTQSPINGFKNRGPNSGAGSDNNLADLTNFTSFVNFEAGQKQANSNSKIEENVNNQSLYK